MKDPKYYEIWTQAPHACLVFCLVKDLRKIHMALASCLAKALAEALALAKARALAITSGKALANACYLAKASVWPRPWPGPWLRL